MFDITQRYSASGHADSVQFHDSFCDDSLRNFVQSFFFFFPAGFWEEMFPAHAINSSAQSSMRRQFELHFQGQLEFLQCLAILGHTWIATDSN